jgi:hypothetical protein
MILLLSDACLPDDLRFMIALHRDQQMNHDLFPMVQVAIARSVSRVSANAPRLKAMIAAEYEAVDKYLRDADLLAEERQRLSEHVTRLGEVLGLQDEALAESSEDRIRDIRVVPGGHRIALLSDLHLSDVEGNLSWRSWIVGKLPRLRSLFVEQGHILAEGFPSANMKRIINQLATLEITHVLILGDISNLGLREQFQHAHDLCLTLQGTLGKGIGTISPEFITVIPGNHDVTGFREKTKFQAFWSFFRDAFRAGNRLTFPLIKTLEPRSVEEPLDIDILCVDTCKPWPVYLFNATGHVDKRQLERLRGALHQERKGERLRLVVLHHHPILQPGLSHETITRMANMNEEGARNLVSLCCEYGVAGILHGHNHMFRVWYSPQEKNSVKATPVTIIGVPCGTRGRIGENVYFLELRQVSGSMGRQKVYGLSLWRHRLQGDDWEEPEDLHVYLFA